jgi:hypothetical protein
MLLSVRACTTPPPKQQQPALPKRVSRIRRVMESKRMDSLKEFHESLKKTAKNEVQFVQDLLDKTFKDDDDEEDV